jgi:hypothetical protein
MKQNPKTETTPAVKPGAAPQTKRYDEAFKQAAVANWIKTGQLATGHLLVGGKQTIDSRRSDANNCSRIKS